MRAADRVIVNRLFLFLWLAMGGSALANIVEGGTGLLYGTGYSYWLTAPDGWVIDNESGARQMMSHAVFYPKDQTWQNAPVIFYTNVWKITAEDRTPADVARHDIVEFHANGSPGYTGSYSETWKLPHGGHAEVWRFHGDKWGNYEAIAYIPAKKIISFVVITGRTQKLFDQAFPKFRELVTSFQWSTEEVHIDKTGQPSAPVKKP
jgi:hypothetical protein